MPATQYSYQSLINWGASQLYECSDTPKIDAEVLAQHVFECDMAWLIAHGNEVPNTDAKNDFQELIKQRSSGKPVAYLTGTKWFWSLELKVNEHVLVPRPETETLVESALNELVHKAKILDLGTGSGAIALALGKERSDCSVTALDNSEAALEVARANAKANQIDNVEFLKSDWFQAVAQQQFDLIVSNPPYIDQNDPTVEPNVRDHEPSAALFSEQNGLADLESIADPVKLLMQQNGFDTIQHHKDLSGHIRVTQGSWQDD